MMNPDGTNVENLIQPTFNGNLEVSPDGQKLLIYKENRMRLFNLPNETNMDFDCDFYQKPSFSNDSSKFVFVNNCISLSIQIVHTKHTDKSKNNIVLAYSTI